MSFDATPSKRLLPTLQVNCSGRDLDLCPLTLKPFRQRPRTCWIFVPSLSEICPLSKERLHRMKYVLMDARQMGVLQPVLRDWARCNVAPNTSFSQKSALDLPVILTFDLENLLNNFNSHGKYLWQVSRTGILHHTWNFLDNTMTLTFDLWPTNMTNSNAEESSNSSDGVLVSSRTYYL